MTPDVEAIASGPMIDLTRLQELPPCPFCGSEDVSMSFSATLESPEPAHRFVECYVCAASGPSCDVIDGDDADAQERAASAWSDRA